MTSSMSRGSERKPQVQKRYRNNKHVYIYIHISISIPRTQMTLILWFNCLTIIFMGQNLKHRGHLGSRYMYLFISISFHDGQIKTNLLFL